MTPEIGKYYKRTNLGAFFIITPIKEAEDSFDVLVVTCLNDDFDQTGKVMNWKACKYKDWEEVSELERALL